MKQNFFIPRLMIPCSEYKSWGVAPASRKVYEGVGHRLRKWQGKRSAFELIVPETEFDILNRARLEALYDNMYRVLEEDILEKLMRGFILTAHDVQSGLHCGVVAAFDLEEFSPDAFERPLFYPVQDCTEFYTNGYARIRKGAILEIPHVVIGFQDKKDKLLKSLLSRDLEEVYSEKESDGTRGYFIPVSLAQDTAKAMQAKAEPCFTILEGVDAVAGARLHWEGVKKKLGEAERRFHPARYMLAEFVNLCDESVRLCPVHRLISCASAEEFCDYFVKNVKCERHKNLLVLSSGTGAAIREAESVIHRFSDGGGAKSEPIADAQSLKELVEEDACKAGVLFGEISKDDLIKTVKSAKTYPARSFCIGGEDGGRYHFEAREISYD